MLGRLFVAGAVPAIALCGCAREGARPPSEPPQEFIAVPSTPPPRAEVQSGNATWYGGSLAGHHTASGEIFDPRRMTAAHRTLPFGTWVEVTCVDTGQSVRVRITDRGPFGHEDRVIDLSRAAADKIGIRRRGVARVELRVVSGP
jgi:rare lipoprotein A (peptidoglycan hydrolase)